MKTLGCSLLGVLLVVTLSGIATAQESPQREMSIPKVLQIIREYTKPGKSGMAHEKTESAYVQAMTRAKWPTHYLGMTSLSGKERALFLTSYASFEAWEKDFAAMQKNTTLSAALDRILMADGEVLDSVDEGVFIFRDDLSLRPAADLSHMRYMEIAVYQVHLGYSREWDELVKLVKAAYEKGVPDAHWGMFQAVYGREARTFAVITGLKTLAEVDRSFQQTPQFEAALGEDGLKRLGLLERVSVASSQHQLFAISPRMSYVPEEWIKADPDFWKPKTVAAPAAKPATEEKKAKP